MGMKHIIILALAAALSSSATVIAQGTLEDYNRAYSLSKRYNYGQVPNGRIYPRWIDGTSCFWYMADDSDGAKVYTLVDASRKVSRPMFDHKALAAALSSNGVADVKPEDLRLERLRTTGAADTLWFERDGHVWQYVNRKKGVLTDRGTVPDRKSVV